MKTRGGPLILTCVFLLTLGCAATQVQYKSKPRTPLWVNEQYDYFKDKIVEVEGRFYDATPAVFVAARATPRERRGHNTIIALLRRSAAASPSGPVPAGEAYLPLVGAPSSDAFASRLSLRTPSHQGPQHTRRLRRSSPCAH